MSITPATSVLVQGLVSQTPPPAGYFRLDVPKQLLSKFIDIPISGIVFPMPIQPPPTNTSASFHVGFGSEIKFSDPSYNLPPVSVTTPVKPFPLKPSTSASPTPAPFPLKPGFYGSDGTLLTPQEASGQIAGFYGTAKNGFNYGLFLESGASPDSDQKLYSGKPWVYVRLSLYKAPQQAGQTPTTLEQFQAADPSPLQFGIAYGPLFDRIQMFITCGNVSAGINAQTNSQVSQNSDGTFDFAVSATPTRATFYYENSYGSESVNMADGSTDPGIYFPIVSLFWPFTERMGFFEPALRSIAAATADTLPVLPQTPLHLLGELVYGTNPGLNYPPSWSVEQYIAFAAGTVGPAIGPFAAEFLPPDSGIQPWADAACWMGWSLFKGIGIPNLSSAFTAQYAYCKSYVPPQHVSGGKFPTMKTPQAGGVPSKVDGGVNVNVVRDKANEK